MQIAYMLLVHHQPNHLARLIRALNAPWAHFFIHVDKNADISDFLLKVPETSKVHYLHERERISWGGFSIVKATLRLLHGSFHYGIPFKYHVLLSGDDYPIKGNRIIYEFLNRSSLQYIATGNELSRLRPERFKKYWFSDNAFLNPRPRSYIKPDTFPEKIMHRLAPGLLRSFQSILQLLPERQPPYFTHYMGSQWWTLTRNCVEHILEFVKKHKKYTRFHKHTAVPDEHFFHSIVKASPFADSMATYVGYYLSNRYALHYIDWRSPPERPKILTEKDLENLISTEALFARKFDEVRSANLLESIDRHIEGH